MALILLSIALVEGFIILVDLLRPAPDKFQLAEAEINVPQRSVEVPQFVFENKQIKKLDTALQNLEDSLNNSLLDKINNLEITKIMANIKEKINFPSEFVFSLLRNRHYFLLSILAKIYPLQH